MNPLLDSAVPARFVYGGVAVEMLRSRDEGFEFGPELEKLASVDPGATVAGSVHVTATCIPEEQVGDARAIDWRWDGVGCELRAGPTRAQVRQLSERRFAATAVSPPTPWGMDSLLGGLSSLVINRAGGLILHASAVSLGSEAVLFIGRSGAGKTTAANQCLGARSIAHDRAVAFPRGDRWWAAGLRGGEACDLPPEPCSSLSLGAVFIVVADRRVRVERLETTTAVLRLRESAFALNAHEEQRFVLERVAALVATNRVFALHTALGVNLAPVIAQHLSSGGQ
ncbi:MAG: hypothetical protein AB7S26_05105 [Sandaracinaceae bacterium]